MDTTVTHMHGPDQCFHHAGEALSAAWLRRQSQTDQPRVHFLPGDGLKDAAVVFIPLALLILGVRLAALDILLPADTTECLLLAQAGHAACASCRGVHYQLIGSFACGERAVGASKCLGRSTHATHSACTARRAAIWPGRSLRCLARAKELVSISRAPAWSRAFSDSGPRQLSTCSGRAHGQQTSVRIRRVRLITKSGIMRACGRSISSIF